MSEALLTTQLALSNRRSGKVRDLYDTTLPDGEPALLIVATDRISAFDVVLANGLPGKGIVLTQISKFWFEHFADRFTHHLVSTDVADLVGITDAQRRVLRGRIMLCRKAEVLPIECIARGYLTGSGWQDYQRSGKVCGIELPAGLVDGDRLAEPLFTPSTKAETGHDENISFEQGAAIVGSDRMRWLQQTSLALYGAASDYARARGIIVADTKFEFGIAVDSPDSPQGAREAFLIDEIFTPDSSRFWPVAQWQPGAAQPSFDKQVVRDYLQQQVNAGAWDKTPPGPMLPESIVALSVERYLEAFERLTGAPLDLAQYAD